MYSEAFRLTLSNMPSRLSAVVLVFELLTICVTRPLFIAVGVDVPIPTFALAVILMRSAEFVETAIVPEVGRNIPVFGSEAKLIDGAAAEPSEKRIAAPGATNLH